MLKAIEKLLNGTATQVGNHRVECTTDSKGHTIEKYYYHATAVCTVDRTAQTFKTDNGGWGTSSTSRAIKDYREAFVYNDYCEVFDSFNKMTEQLVEVPVGQMYRCYLDSESTRTEVTITKHTLPDNEKVKLAVIVVAKENENTCKDFNIKYRGSKTLETAIKEQIGNSL